MDEVFDADDAFGMSRADALNNFPDIS